MADPEDAPAAPLIVLRPVPGSSTVVVVIGGPIAGADVPRLCQRIRAVLEGSDAELVVCDVGALVEPDVGTVDALARLALTARRLGCQVRLRHPCVRLQGLLALVGLCDVVPLAAELPVELRGQPKHREQARGVQERVEPDDPTG